MTKKTPKERLKEWQAEHPNLVLKTKQTWQVKTNSVKFLERLVHNYLDYCRMHRYVIGARQDALYSVWAVSGLPVPGEPAKPEDERLVARSKMVEWFCAPWTEVHTLMDALVKLYSPP
jgi:hypothetical protein